VLWVRLPTFYCFEAELSGLSMADTILNCSDLSDYLGAYSIGATTPTENRMIEALLAECPEAQQELREYMAVREALTHMPITNELDDIDLPPLNLPAMTPVAVASETHTHTHSHTPTVQRTITQTQPIPRHHHKDETDPIAKLQLTQPPASRQETPATESKTRRFPAAVWYAFGSVAAALILVVGMGTFATQLIDEMQSERDALFTLVATESARETTIINVQPTPVDQAVSSVSNGGTVPAEEAVHVHLTPAVDESYPMVKPRSSGIQKAKWVHCWLRTCRIQVQAINTRCGWLARILPSAPGRSPLMSLARACWSSVRQNRCNASMSSGSA
jgi:hypothetical protein